jgi:hypothetical protein
MRSAHHLGLPNYRPGRLRWDGLTEEPTATSKSRRFGGFQISGSMARALEFPLPCPALPCHSGPGLSENALDNRFQIPCFEAR